MCSNKHCRNNQSAHLILAARPCPLTPYNPHRIHETKGLSWWTAPFVVRMCVAMDEDSSLLGAWRGSPWLEKHYIKYSQPFVAIYVFR